MQGAHRGGGGTEVGGMLEGRGEERKHEEEGSREGKGGKLSPLRERMA